jgi:hypothetical protein
LWKLLNYYFQDAIEEGGPYSNDELAKKEIVKQLGVGFESIRQKSHFYGEYDGTKQDISPSNHHNKNMFVLLQDCD